MKKNAAVILFSFIFVMLIAASSVGAAGNYQATATRDIRTPPFTPTPYNPVNAELNFDCPAGVPGGYGEVEADPSWLVSCAHCLPTATAWPTFSGWETIGITCFSGDLGCRTDGDGRTYLAQGSAIPSSAGFAFTADYVGDVYMYLRLAGYQTLSFGLRGMDEVPLYFVVAVNDEIIDVLEFPLDNLPDYYEFVIPVDGDTSTSYGVQFYINDTGGLGGDVDFMQDFRCSRVYLSDVALSSGDFEAVTCAVYSAPTCTDPPTFTPAAPTPTSPAAIWEIEIIQYDDWHNAGDSQTLTSETWVPGCSVGNVVSSCWAQYDITAKAGTSFGGWHRPNLDIQVKNVSGATQTLCVSYETSDTGSFHPSVAINNVIRGTSPFSENAFCNWTVANNASQNVQIDMQSASNYTANSMYTHHIVFNVGSSPAPVYTPTPGGPTPTPGPTYAPCTGTVTPGPIGGPLTGNFCDEVLPFDTSTDLDLEIWEEGPRECTQIPYFSLVEALPDWLAAIIDDDFIDFLNSWAFFPASTFCYHSVDFQTQYILNVPLNLSLLAGALMVVWFLYRITTK